MGERVTEPARTDIVLGCFTSVDFDDLRLAGEGDLGGGLASVLSACFWALCGDCSRDSVRG